MLSDEAIEKLMQPIIDRQEAINSFVIQEIAKKIKEIGELRQSDLYRLTKLLKTGSDVRKINAEIARLTGLQISEIKSMIRRVAMDSYLEAKPFYDYRHKSFIPFADNVTLQRIVKSIENETAKSYRNLADSRATGFLIRDIKRPGKLKFQPIGDTYQSVIDEAIQAAQTGVLDYGTVMRRTLRQLVDSGVRRIYWDSGYTQRLDSAVKRNILDGIKAIHQGVQEQIGKEFGADGIELTAHARPAPDHAPVQGRQFTLEQFNNMQTEKPFEDLTGRKFEGFVRHIGYWNCKHLAYRIVVGVSKPTYSEEQLQKILDANEAGYTMPSGKHMTGYECVQHQNQLALKVRQAKDGQIAARAAGDDLLAQKYQAQINKYSTMYKKFSKDAGLSERKDKLTVSGYHRISTKIMYKVS